MCQFLKGIATYAIGNFMTEISEWTSTVRIPLVNVLDAKI